MKSAPILIIDKVGLIGEPLSAKLSKEFPVVFVSRKLSAQVPFSKRFPIIPDNKYSHIIVIDDDGEGLEFLPKIIEKARNINSNFIFSQGLSHKGEYLVNKILSMYSSSKVVLYGDIFDDKLIHRIGNFDSVINKFLYQAQKFQRIQIQGDGLTKAYPVFIADVVDGLIDVIFGINNSRSLFYIFPKHPPSELSLAHMIQKANPEVGIDFISHGAKQRNIFFPLNGRNLLDDKYPLAKKIRNIDIEKTTKIEDYKFSNDSHNIKRFPILIVWVLILLILSPIVFTLLFSFLGLNTLYFAKAQIDRGSFSNAKSSLHLSQTFFIVGKKTSDILLFQGKLIGRGQNLKRLIEDIDLGNKISQGLLQAFRACDFFTKVLNGTSKNPAEDFTKGQSYLKSTVVMLEKLRAEEKMPAQFIAKVKSIDPLIKLLSNTSDILPGVFGIEGPRIYLMLFQNNMELRPGGGFVGSYGILKLSMGKIEEFSIHDIYDADGQLRGHVEPPFAIRRYLPSAHWYMRDSNFDVDFVKSASSSSNFLNAETGQRADGVIGVDVTFVKNILHAIGPVYVTDYKETVDENNLYMLTQTHSEKNFFPGSTQKKDFLRSLYKSIMAKISGENVSYLLLAQAISDSLSQKHLIFAFNANTQNIFTVNGWSSSLWDERKQDEKSVNDFLGINEANLGVNKANYFISRKVTHKVAIDNGKVLEELNIDYKNDSIAWPGGDYKNYLRVILPKDTAISEISINDISQPIVPAITDPLIYEAKNFKAPLGLELEKVNQDGKTIYGFIINVRVGKITKVKIKYVLPGSVSNLSAFSYNLKLFKQPGIESIPYSFSLIYPSSFNVVKTTDGINRGEGKVSYSEKVVEDKNLIIDFSKK